MSRTKINLILYLLVFFSCSIKQNSYEEFLNNKKILTNDDANQFLEICQSYNNSTHNAKAIANLSIIEDERSLSFKVAWMSKKDAGFRMEILNVLSQPFYSLSSDLENFYFYSHEDKKLYKKSISSYFVKNLPISINPLIMTQLLLCKVPILKYDDIFLEKKFDGEDIYILHLFKDKNLVEKIFYDNQKNIYRFDFFDQKSFSVFLADVKKQKDDFVFKNFLVRAFDNSFFYDFELFSFYTNVKVDENKFVLKSKEIN